MTYVSIWAYINHSSLLQMKGGSEFESWKLIPWNILLVCIVLLESNFVPLVSMTVDEHGYTSESFCRFGKGNYTENSFLWSITWGGWKKGVVSHKSANWNRH